MKFRNLFLLAPAILAVTACGPNKKSSLSNTVPAPPAAGVAFPNTSTQGVNVPVATPPGPAGPVTAQPLAAPSSGAVAMNPAHGQPLHRCDIPVGAPLNSPAGAPPATPNISAPVLPAPTPAPTSVAAGMNPPHGQPGHDCAVPVGSPLTKK